MRESAREALLNAAQRLFAERGYSQVSTRELAEAAGVNLGAIQYYFGSKQSLFIAAVHCMLNDCTMLRSQLTGSGPCTSRLDAAQRLRDFIYGLLTYILRPTGPQATRVMCREVLCSSSEDGELFEQLVDSVVTNFSRPTHNALVTVLETLSPQLSDSVRSQIVASIVGQCTFYVTHRPFVERIRQEDLSDDLAFNSIAEHVIRFTLQGIRCEDDLINQILPLK